MYMLCNNISQLLRMLIPADLQHHGFSPDDWKKVSAIVKDKERLLLLYTRQL